MRITSVVVGAIGYSDWIPMDTYRLPFNASAAVSLTDTPTLTYSVEVTYDDLGLKQLPAIARTTTTATVTLADHGLTVGDSVRVEGAGAPLDGVFKVATVTNGNVFTYTVANSGATASAVGATIVIMRVFVPSAFSAKTAKVDSVISAPTSAVRLSVTSWSAGKATLTVAQAI